MRSLVNDSNVVIKKAGKCLCVGVWYREDYIAEAERQLGHVTVYKDVDFKEKMLQDLAETSNEYFTIDLKKATNLVKLYLLPKIHKRLFKVAGRPVISNCGTPTENVAAFLDS